MLRNAWGVLSGILLAGAVSACAFVDTVDPRYDTVNRAAANARNESILLNIVRASHNIPLNFVNLSKVTGQTTIQGNAGLPGFAEGPKPLISTFNRQVIFGSTTLSGSTSANNTMEVSTLETKDFYTALLSPVDLATLNYFVRQGYSRDLLFWLFTESVEETIRGRTVGYANVLDEEKRCNVHPAIGVRKCFEDLIDIAVLTGLTVETASVEKPGARGVQLHGRFCFDVVQATNGARDMAAERRQFIRSLLVGSSHIQPRCRSVWNPAGEAKEGPAVVKFDTLTFDFRGTPVGTVSYRIVTRSTFGIYQFLGALLRDNNRDVIISTAPSGEDSALLRIIRGLGGPCVIDVHFLGENYCVPAEGAENTKRIFSLLAQLIALRTSVQDLAITPSVRTIN